VNAGWSGNRADEAQEEFRMIQTPPRSITLYAHATAISVIHLESLIFILHNPTRKADISSRSFTSTSMLKSSNRVGTSLIRTMSSAPGYLLRQRRFAPLNPELSLKSNAPPLKGIVFDVDGTLWLVCLFFPFFLSFRLYWIFPFSPDSVVCFVLGGVLHFLQILSRAAHDFAILYMNLLYFSFYNICCSL
jgi:hypothetical protein